VLLSRRFRLALPNGSTAYAVEPLIFGPEKRIIGVIIVVDYEKGIK